MSPALRAMVEAMAAEMVRQADEANGVRGGVIYETGPGEYTIDARAIDLEKVARAALASLREEPRHDLALDLFPGLSRKRWRGAIDAILKDAP